MPNGTQEVGVSSRENPPSAAWTYRMEVSPTGQGAASPTSNPSEPIVLLHLLVNLQNQTLDSLRQLLEVQRQQLDLARETVQVSREQRARQGAELERWQVGHDHVLDACRDTQIGRAHV